VLDVQTLRPKRHEMWLMWSIHYSCLHELYLAAEVVLIHAAAGGVGLTLVQMAKILGATVIGTVSSKEKEDLAKEFGADYVINYSHEDVVTRVQEITNGLGCHAVLDGVGASTFDASIKSTRRCGIFVSFGDASGSIPPVSLSMLQLFSLFTMSNVHVHYR
jgi:NADPH2:quinone reductase